MEEIRTPQTETPVSTIIDFLTVVTKYRKFISRFVVSTTIIVTIIALLMPKWYKSTASVFPAEKTDLFGMEGISSLAKNFSPSKALGLGTNPEADRYMAILKSGKVIGAVIREFKLDSVYGITSFKGEKTGKELMSNTEFTEEQEGNITISVYDRDPQRAADIANYFVEMLNKTNSELQVQNAKGNREFIEERYRKNMVDLAKAEDSLRLFQKRYGIIAMPEQTEASIKAGAEITAQLALKEVQVGVLRRTQSPDNPAVVAGQIEVDELRNKLSQMSNAGTHVGKDMRLFVPFNNVPDLGMEYLRRYRDVEIQYKILQFITPLFEQAKVEERRQTPSVIVLDKAGPAERKAKPKVSLYALIAFTVSLLVVFFMIFIREGLLRLKQAHPERYVRVASDMRSDWFGLRFWGRQ
jgi:tyrosine-protein kinase Etk/Wzc